MTPETPTTPAEMQREIAEIESWIDSLNLEKHTLDTEEVYDSIKLLLAYIRSLEQKNKDLEADHAAMKAAIVFACDHCSCENCEIIGEKAIREKTMAKPCGMHERLNKVLNSLRLK